MRTCYSLDELQLIYVDKLPRQTTIDDLTGEKDQSCLLFKAESERVATPTIVYNGAGRLYPTIPNFLADSNPEKLFPNVVDGHDLFVSRLPQAMCLDGGIIITQSSQLFSESFRTISRLKHRVGLQHQANGRFRVEVAPRKVRYIPGKCLFLDGEHFAAYGHFLGEVLTRLWISEFVDLGSFTIICGKDGTPHLWNLLASLGICKEQILLHDGLAICEDLWVPTQSFLVRQSTTRQARSLWRNIGQALGRTTCIDKVYISRSRAHSRSLMNETQVEQLFVDRGFEIVTPEKLSVPEQVSVFCNASWIAGCSGSNMFNCVFSGLNQRKFFLTSRNYILHTDVLINIESNNKMTYFIGEPQRERDVHSPWVVEVEALGIALDNWLKAG